MTWLRPTLCALALAAFVGVSGCGAPPCGHDGGAGADVAVHPRLVMDGLVDLAAREHGHVQITEVVFHAPEVERADADVQEPLAGQGAADDALVFRYAIGANDSLGDIVGGERRWQIAPSGELVFSFSPASAEDVDALTASTGVNLESLVGQTAFVRGTVAVPISEVHGFTGGAEDGDPDTSPADGDPDTSPADEGEESDGDPDTSPADEGPESDGDPDTSPADKDDESDGDPDTSPADGDPDTSPARSEQANTAERRDDDFASRRHVDLTNTHSLAHVPFVLVVKERFALHRPVADLRIEELARDEVLPIDLHVDMDALFSPERVAQIDAVARDGGLATTVVVEGSVDGAVRLKLDAKAVKKVATSAQGIRVVGDHR